MKNYLKFSTSCGCGPHSHGAHGLWSPQLWSPTVSGFHNHETHRLWFPQSWFSWSVVSTVVIHTVCGFHKTYGLSNGPHLKNPSPNFLHINFFI